MPKSSEASNNQVWVVDKEKQEQRSLLFWGNRYFGRRLITSVTGYSHRCALRRATAIRLASRRSGTSSGLWSSGPRADDVPSVLLRQRAAGFVRPRRRRRRHYPNA